MVYGAKFFGLMCLLVSVASQAGITDRALESAVKISVLIDRSDGLDLQTLIPPLQRQLQTKQSEAEKFGHLRLLFLYHRYLGKTVEAQAYAQQMRELRPDDRDAAALVEFFSVLDTDAAFDDPVASVEQLKKIASRYDLKNNIRQQIYFDVVSSHATLRSYHDFQGYQTLINHYNKLGDNSDFAFEMYMVLWQAVRCTFNVEDSVWGIGRLLEHTHKYRFGLNRAVLLYNLSDRSFGLRRYDLAEDIAAIYLGLVKRMNFESEYFYAYFIYSKIIAYGTGFSRAEPYFKLAAKHKPTSDYWTARLLVNHATYLAKSKRLDEAQLTLNKAEQLYQHNTKLQSNRNEPLYTKGIISLYRHDHDQALAFFDSYWSKRRMQVMEGQLDKLRGVRGLLQKVIAQEQAERHKAQMLLTYFQFACTGLALAIIAVLFLTLRQYRIARALEKSKKKLSQANKRLERRSQTDGLTSLKNKSFWQSRLVQEFSRLNRNPDGRSCLIILDIDFFKKINDSYGHPMGDQVIQAVAKIIRLAIRKSDVAGRIGGEEFALMLPDTDAAAAFQFAERIRSEVARLCFRHAQEKFQCTISLGVAEFELGFSSARNWLECADSSLYHAKRSGRNNTKVYTRQISSCMAQ